MPRFYDKLARFAFRKRLIRAEKQFINFLQPENSILLIGEGTGKILNHIFSKVENVHIDYIEPSEKKLAIAKKHLDPKYMTRVNFILGDHNNIPVLIQYDAVITFFVFNMFKQEDAIKFARAINSSLKPEGIWLFTDFFSTPNLYHKILLGNMGSLFSMFNTISANKLPAYNSIFRHLRFTLVAEEYFWRGFIRSVVYAKEFVKPV